MIKRNKKEIKRKILFYNILIVALFLTATFLFVDTYFDLDLFGEDLCYEFVDGIKEEFNCRDNFEVEKRWKANRPILTEDGSWVTESFYYK